MTGATGNLYVGLHEFEEMGFLLHFLRPGDVFLDIGANVGSYAVLAAGACGARTIAFEPDPETARRLERNVAINGLGRIVEIRRVALGDGEGEIRFTLGRDTMNRVASAQDQTTQCVRMSTLDAQIGEARPIMMKIDVEGFEERALVGAVHTLQRDSLRAVVIETATPTSREMLSAAGFEEARYDPAQRALTPGPGDGAALNVLWVRDWTFIAARIEAAREFEVFGRRF